MHHPSMFRIVGLPPRFFGESHVVVSVWNEGLVWKAEYSLLSKKPVEHLIQCVVEFDTMNYPAELPAIDYAFMEGEALRQAELDLGLELERRATDANQDELAYLPIGFERESITPVTLWTRNAYPVKFADMATGTKSPDMKRYLQMVMSLARLRPSSS